MSFLRKVKSVFGGGDGDSDDGSDTEEKKLAYDSLEDDDAPDDDSTEVVPATASGSGASSSSPSSSEPDDSSSDPGSDSSGGLLTGGKRKKKKKTALKLAKAASPAEGGAGVPGHVWPEVAQRLGSQLGAGAAGGDSGGSFNVRSAASAAEVAERALGGLVRAHHPFGAKGRGNLPYDSAVNGRVEPETGCVALMTDNDVHVLDSEMRLLCTVSGHEDVRGVAIADGALVRPPVKPLRGDVTMNQGHAGPDAYNWASGKSVEREDSPPAPGASVMVYVPSNAHQLLYCYRVWLDVDAARQGKEKDGVGGGNDTLRGDQATPYLRFADEDVRVDLERVLGTAHRREDKKSFNFLQDATFALCRADKGASAEPVPCIFAADGANCRTYVIHADTYERIRIIMHSGGWPWACAVDNSVPEEPLLVAMLDEKVGIHSVITGKRAHNVGPIDHEMGGKKFNIDAHGSVYTAYNNTIRVLPRSGDGAQGDSAVGWEADFMDDFAPQMVLLDETRNRVILAHKEGIYSIELAASRRVKAARG